MHDGRRLLSLGLVAALHVAVIAALLRFSYEKTDAPDYRGITISPSGQTPALSGLNNSLFGCADGDKLRPEDRARCGAALVVPGNTVDFPDGTGRSQAAALWERGRQRKNGPCCCPA
jgi:hypothetical protein